MGGLIGQVPHENARTAVAVPRAIQQSQESLRVLSWRYGIHPKTVAKWKKRTHDTDALMRPKQPHSTGMTPAEEALIVAFRRHTLLPLDDCAYALQAILPQIYAHEQDSLTEIELRTENQRKAKYLLIWTLGTKG